MKRVFAILTSVLMASCLYAQETGDDAVLAKLFKQDRRQRVWPSLWGKLGKYTNKPETLHRYYLVNS